MCGPTGRSVSTINKNDNLPMNGFNCEATVRPEHNPLPVMAGKKLLQWEQQQQPPGKRIATVIKEETLTGSLTECKWLLERAPSEPNMCISLHSEPTLSNSLLLHLYFASVQYIHATNLILLDLFLFTQCHRGRFRGVSFIPFFFFF